MTADRILRPDAPDSPPFDSITTREAIALLERVRIAHDTIAATIADLELFIAELPDLPDHQSAPGWLRHELEEAVQELDVAAGMYLAPDMDSPGCSLAWLTRRVAAADGGEVLP